MSEAFLAARRFRQLVCRAQTEDVSQGPCEDEMRVFLLMLFKLR